MKRISIAAVLIAAAWAPAAFATCSGGFTLYLSGQLPDVTFTAGVPETIHFNPYYAAFTSSSGSCGIFARATVPGLSIQDSYGCPGSGCPVRPPGQWAAVGDAYNPPTNTVAHKGTDITMIFDGTAPAGWIGMVEIGILDNDHGDFSTIAIMGRMNVYVASAAPPPTTWFTVTATAGTISGSSLILNHPYLNSNPSARLFVTHVRNPGGTLAGTLWNHGIGVLYNATLQRWTIRNNDGAAMTPGVAFGVRTDPTAPQICVGSAVSSVPIDNWLSNNNVWATVFVTQVGGTAHPLAVRYVSPNWQIVYSDGASIPAQQCFNVKVFPFTQYLGDPASGDLSSRSNVTVNYGVGVDTSGFGTGHNSGSGRYLQFDWAYGNSFRPMVTTFNQTPLGFTAYVDPHYFGFGVPQPDTPLANWAVLREDGASMNNTSRFNVWAPCAANAWYPDADGDGYGAASGKVVSCNHPGAGYVSASGDCNDALATVHPGAIEIGDGLDNQCPGEQGFGVVDEISGTSGFFDLLNKGNFCWPAQSGTVEYKVGRSGTRTFATCTTLGTTTSTCFTDPAVPDRARAFYYLVRAERHRVGSWGQQSTGQERILSCP